MKPRSHSQNQGFRWETPLGPFRRITTDQARQWSEQGFFVLEDAIDRPTLERLIAEIDPWEAKAEAGSMVVFSSLTPHATGPNLSSETRKAYIVQLAPDGARRMEPNEGRMATRRSSKTTRSASSRS